jgi:hypothetical protein
MNIIAAILILGATGHAERSMVVEQEISGIVARCVAGGVKDVFSGTRQGLQGGRTGSYIRASGKTLQLQIDNQPRTGWKSWVEAVCRTAGYAADWKLDGSIEYEYRLRLRGYDIRRATRIENGCVVLTTDAWWVEVVPVGRSTRGIQIHVTITITAREHNESTLLVGLATGTAGLADFRCRIVRRIAERQASEALRVGLAEALLSVEFRGREWYFASDNYAGVLDGIGEAMRTVGPRIGRRQ